MGQKYSFSFADTVLAEIGGVTLNALHSDVDAILHCYEKIRFLAERLGVPAPVPRLAGFAYPHLAAIGAEIVFAENSEPKPTPLIKSADEIDRLAEPGDYLAAPLIRQRLELCRKLQERWPQSPAFIGHPLEGPITTAMLIMGQDFLMLPYDDPEKAHQLLEFSVRSALNYANTLSSYFGSPIKPGPRGIPDDFAGMFPPEIFKEFVVPYLNQIYVGLKSTFRHLHSELLRPSHLGFLKELKIDYYDPGADQYLTPEILSQQSPCKFQSVIQSWHIHDLSVPELEKMYRTICGSKPDVICFCMSTLDEEPKIISLLKLARDLH